MNKQDSIDRENKRVPDEEWVDMDIILLYLTADVYPKGVTHQEICDYAKIVGKNCKDTGIVFLHPHQEILHKAVKECFGKFLLKMDSDDVYYCWDPERKHHLDNGYTSRVPQILENSLIEYREQKNAGDKKGTVGHVKRKGTQ